MFRLWDSSFNFTCAIHWAACVQGRMLATLGVHHSTGSAVGKGWLSQTRARVPAYPKSWWCVQAFTSLMDWRDPEDPLPSPTGKAHLLHLSAQFPKVSGGLQQENCHFYSLEGWLSLGYFIALSSFWHHDYSTNFLSSSPMFSQEVGSFLHRRPDMVHSCYRCIFLSCRLCLTLISILIF